MLNGNEIISGRKEITKKLRQYYSDQFKESSIDKSDSHVSKVIDEYNEIRIILSVSTELTEKTSIVEIRMIVRSLKPKKSTRFDQIPNFMIKKLPISYIECLVVCFNQWLSECRYPDEWKLAKIVTLNKLKSGVPKCNQTRPISLLATHSKLLLNRVKHWVETNHIIPVEQSGFRSRCLLSARVLSIFQEVKNNMAASIPTLAVYVDYQKAYDRVWHAVLITKLWRLRIPIYLLKLIISWLKLESPQ